MPRTNNTNRSIIVHLMTMVIAIVMSFTAVRSSAQNNVYKIDDTLYGYYKRANNNLTKDECLAIADTMLQKAIEKGDKKAVCIALTLPVRHYLKKKDIEHLTESCSRLDRTARECNLLQYCYFAKSMLIIFNLNEHHFLSAIQGIEEMYEEALKDKYPYGIALALRDRANIYVMQLNYERAKGYMRETIEYMREHVPDQDIAPTYNKLAQCCQLSNEPTEAIEYCLEALKIIKNPNNYYDILNTLLTSYYEAGPDYKDDFLLTYDNYKQYIEKQTSGKDNRYLRVLRELFRNNIEEAERIANEKDNPFHYSSMLQIHMKKGEYQQALEIRKKFLRQDMQSAYNESPSYQLAEFDASFAHSKLQVDRMRLEYEMAQQMLQQTLAEAELEGKKHDNERVQLANDSLQWAKLKDDSMKIAEDKMANASELAIWKTKARQKWWMQAGAFAALLIVACYAITAMLRSRRNIRMLNEKHTQLVNALDHAEESERMKSSFVKNLSHDIRTPLNAVVGFSEILLESGNTLSDEEKDMIKEKIEKNSDTLTTLVNDILLLSYIESERQVVDKNDCDLNDTIDEAIAKSREDKGEGVEIVFEKDKYDTTTIFTDKKLLVTAMSRMLAFATHQTTGKKVTIRQPENDADTTVTTIDYEVDEKTVCNESMFLGSAFYTDDMEAYKMALPTCRAAMTRLGGTVAFDKAGKGFARIVLTHPVRLIATLFILCLAMACPRKASAQFTKDKLDEATYQIYREAQNKRELPEGLEKARQIYKIGQKRNDKYIQCVGLGVELQHHVMNSNDDKAFATISLLQKLAKECNDTIYYYMAFSNEIAIHLNNKHTLTAMKKCMEKHEEAEKANDTYGLYTTLRALGDIYRVRNNHIKSCDCYIRAMKLLDRHHITHDPTMSILRIVKMKRNMGDLTGAETYIKEARKHARIERYHYLINLEEAMLAFELNDTARFRKLYDRADEQQKKHGFRYPNNQLTVELMEMVFDNETEEAISLANSSLDSLSKCHLLTAIKTNEKKWDEAFAWLNKENMERKKLRAKVYDNDQNEMNDIIGNNNLEANNMSLRLKAANLQIEHNKATAELEKSMQEEQRLLTTNYRLKMSKMSAQASLDSASLRRNRMQTEQQRVQNRQSTVMFLLTSAIAVMILLLVILYNRAKRLHALKMTRKNEELDRAREKAEMSDKMKSVFIQDMSHEIRTPLNAIVGFSQLMLQPGMDFDEEEKKSFAKTIRHNSELLMTLVSDIISLSELESGRYEVKMQEVKVNDLCRMAINSVKHKQKPSVPIGFETGIDDDYKIVSDGKRICQVLINYLTNAIKYTEEGHITLGCAIESNRLVFSVTDTGQGIPLDKQKEIFERFSKLDNFHQGTGLGLNICRLIADKLGGEVCTDPTYTDGARFLFIVDK